MSGASTHLQGCRIAVTGVGLVTPLGIGREDFCKNLFSGVCAIDEVRGFDTGSSPSRLAAEVRGFSPRDFISVKNLRRMDKISQMAVAAARMALEDAGVAVTPENRDRIGILLGSAFGATDITVLLAEALLSRGASYVNPILVPNTVMNAPAGHASIELGFRGVNTTVTHFGVSAENAISYAVSEIRRGRADVMLAGGVDILSKFYYEALGRFRGLSPNDEGPEGSRPFDLRRNGFIAGEGCGLICLEPWDAACARGAKIYCEISGTGLGSSPSPPTAWPGDTDGIKRVLKRALQNAAIEPADVSAIMAAANGSPTLDDTEARAYEEMFYADGHAPFVTTVKGAAGESFSGGGIRACALALSMDMNYLPPVVGLLRPLTELNFIMNESRKTTMRHAVLSGISFGGTYACLVFTNRETKEVI